MVKHSTNLDTLELVFRMQKGNAVFNTLLTNDTLTIEGIKIKVRSRQIEDEEVRKIYADVFYQDLSYKYGEVRITKLGWMKLKIENRALYDTPELKERGIIIGSTLGFDFCKIARVDVCLDTNISLIRRLRQAIKDEELDMYVTRRRIISMDEVIPNFLVGYGATRRNLIRKPTLYFGNSHKTLKMKIYDKERELKASSPEKEPYTRAWSGILTGRLQRMEVTLNREYVDKITQDLGLSHEEFLKKAIEDDAFRTDIVNWGAECLVFFKDRRSVEQHRGDKLGLLDIVRLSDKRPTTAAKQGGNALPIETLAA